MTHLHKSTQQYEGGAHHYAWCGEVASEPHEHVAPMADCVACLKAAADLGVMASGEYPQATQFRCPCQPHAFLDVVSSFREANSVEKRRWSPPEGRSMFSLRVADAHCESCDGQFTVATMTMVREDA